VKQQRACYNPEAGVSNWLSLIELPRFEPKVIETKKYDSEASDDNRVRVEHLQSLNEQ
jgi:hypothetical protein